MKPYGERWLFIAEETAMFAAPTMAHKEWQIFDSVYDPLAWWPHGDPVLAVLFIREMERTGDLKERKLKLPPLVARLRDWSREGEKYAVCGQAADVIMEMRAALKLTLKSIGDMSHVVINYPNQPYRSLGDVIRKAIKNAETK